MKKLLYTLSCLIFCSFVGCADTPDEYGPNESDNPTPNHPNNPSQDEDEGDPSPVYQKITINAVPSTQDSTAGSNCKRASFVEHCNGNSIVYCDSGKVAYDNCSNYTDKTDSYKCRVALKDDSNYADCVAEHDTDSCTVELKSSNYCDKDTNKYETLQYQVCLRFDDGKLHRVNDSFKYCGSLCSEGCKAQEYCDASYADKCSGNIAYICEALQEKYYAVHCAAGCKLTDNKASCK